MLRKSSGETAALTADGAPIAQGPMDPAQAQVILSVRPGITDPVSIAFRHEADLLAAAEDTESHYREVLLPQKAAMYVDYVEGRTLMGDLRILLQTVAAVVRD